MRKILLIIGLFILRSSCVDEDEWKKAVETPGPEIGYTPCGPNMVCVPHSICRNGAVNTDGSGNISPRILECAAGTTCCLLDGMMTTTPSTPPSDPDLSEPEYESCGPNKVCVPPSLCTSGAVNTDGDRLISHRFEECPNILQCCPLDDMGSESVFEVPPLPLGCGHRNPKGVLVTLDGPNDEAEFGEFPWMVAIYVNENTYHCGGSLLHPRVVLTVAHRVYNRRPRSLKVRAGEWERSSENEPLPHQDRQVQRVIVHKDFNKRRQENNIALLIVKRAFDMSPHINTVCLPPVGPTAGNANCFVTGWGETIFNSTKYADIMKRIELKVVPKPTCEAKIQKTRMGPTFRVKPSQICAAGKDGADTCTGDGGSALVCPIPNTDNRYYEVGLVSGGVGCGQRDVPGIYANIAYLLPWIETEFKAKNFNLTYLP